MSSDRILTATRISGKRKECLGSSRKKSPVLLASRRLGHTAGGGFQKARPRGQEVDTE